MNRTTFYYLLNILRPDLEGQVLGFGRKPISPEKQLFIALYVLGTPDSYSPLQTCISLTALYTSLPPSRYIPLKLENLHALAWDHCIFNAVRSITTKFDVGKATAWRAVHRVVKSICKYRNHFIKWPSHNDAMQTANRIERKYKFPNVIGAIDGTHIRISAPKTDSQSYINRKGVHSIQLLVICNDKLEFIYCYAGLPVTVHDMRVFRYSGLQQKCSDEHFPQNSHLLGDAAYTVQKHVMVPYRDNGHLTIEQVYFNTILSKSRMMVERSIGLLKCRWRYLIEKLPMRRTDLIPYYILTCCILHNICLLNEPNFEYPVIIPDDIDEDPVPLLINDDLQVQGEMKRNAICHFLNRNVQ